MAIIINNKIGNFKAYLISPNNKNLGMITNIISLDDVRRQIRKKKAIGYKILFNNEYISIDKNGRLSSYPDELNEYDNILLDLLT